ncbi:polyamine oxidase 7-like [Patiria miniata]|uniref:Amine oxidase n=1 Tax=Patiria miniata TaxID=46514 RepID=A0A913ZPM7_PATMI|nr:polyamine oxidase 7-like [Patiria miniata]
MAVRARVALLLAILGVLACPVRGADYSDNEARVLILGGGAAGLQAARTLHDAGVDDFIIIEAADRVGGRVANTQFANMNVELGPTWALPEVSRTVDLVRQLNLSHRASDYDSLVFRADNGADVTDQTDPLYEVFGPAKEKLGLLRDQMKADSDIPDMSQRSALRVGGWIPDTALHRAIEWFDFDITFGDTPETTSTKETEFIGEEYWMTDARGLKEIFGAVAGFLDAPEYANHTRLNQDVASIDYQNDISVVVTTRDGTRYIGEYVLVTFSLGVLQHDLVDFVPDLPEWKDVEINKFQMTAYTLVYLSFPSKFWGDEEWILHPSDRRGYYPGFFNFQAAGFYPNGTPLLLALITGDEARRVEAQPSADTKAEIEAVLRGMYGDAIPQADGILVTDWNQNPYTKGAFSNFPVEVTTECFDKLQSRVHRVFFGGEATSYGYFGTVDGGLRSGEREADKILECMEDFKACPIAVTQSLECEEAGSSANGLRLNAFLANIMLGLILIMLYV